MNLGLKDNKLNVIYHREKALMTHAYLLRPLLLVSAYIDKACRFGIFEVSGNDRMFLVVVKKRNQRFKFFNCVPAGACVCCKIYGKNTVKYIFTCTCIGIRVY
jgi:hypothetical protein